MVKQFGTTFGTLFFSFVLSDFDGLLRLQKIYRSIPKNDYGTYSFQVDIVKRIDSAEDAIQFLLELEKINRNSLKRVILDCSSQKAKVKKRERGRNQILVWKKPIKRKRHSRKVQ